MNVAQATGICLIGGGLLAFIIITIQNYFERKRYNGLTALEHASKVKIEIIRQNGLDKSWLLLNKKDKE